MKTYCHVCSFSSQKLFHKQGYDFYRCFDCGHQQIDPIPSEEELGKVYEFGFGCAEKGIDAEAAAAEATGDFPLEVFIKMNLPKESAVLDVGCSFGYDLTAFRRHGCENVTGVELSPEGRAIAKERLGLNVYDSVETLVENGMKFDFIYLKHNLEHHRLPQKTLAAISKVMNPGAVVLIGVPNRRSINGLWGKRWEWMTPPIHIHYYSRRSLEHMARNVGLNTLWAKTQQGCALPFLKHVLFFTPLLNQVVRAVWGGPYDPNETKNRGSRYFLERVIRWSEWVFRPLLLPLRRLGFGEELWVLCRSRA